MRVKVLQAGQYGAPQSRKRVIFWGGKRGTLLPEFPKPSHAFQPSFFYKLPTGDTLPPVTCSKDPKNPHQLAPLNAVTVNDAIGDLVGTALNKLMLFIDAISISLLLNGQNLFLVLRSTVFYCLAGNHPTGLFHQPGRT